MQLPTKNICGWINHWEPQTPFFLAVGTLNRVFSPELEKKNTKDYVGIWNKNIPKDKIAWVANYAVQTSSAVLTIQPDGNLVIIEYQ